MDPNGLYDVYSMWYVPWWQRPLFVWGVGLLGAAGLLFLLAIIIKKFFFKKKPKTPWEVAAKRLSDAHAQVGTQNFDAGQFYAQVSGALKQYLIDRYMYDLAGKTDTELLAHIQGQAEFPATLMPLMVGLLERAAEAKFAKGKAIVEQTHEDYALALQIIRQTIPIERTEEK